jgi:hypothetical protein
MLSGAPEIAIGPAKASFAGGGVTGTVALPIIPLMVKFPDALLLPSRAMA